MNEYLENIGKRARAAQFKLSVLSTEDKNKGLKAVADKLCEKASDIIEKNKIDVENANACRGMHTVLYKRGIYHVYVRGI